MKDLKLISAGKILENNRTVGECRSPLCDIPGGVTTMHVVVQPSSMDKGTNSLCNRRKTITKIYMLFIFPWLSLGSSAFPFGLNNCLFFKLKGGKKGQRKSFSYCFNKTIQPILFFCFLVYAE